MSQLEIKDLHVSIEDKEILKGLSLNINRVRSTPLWDRTERGSPRWHTH
jgi:Fe-S cluster assembly ATPase SufC